jgi:hypothetical protein
MRRTVADCRSSIVAGLIALLTLAWPGPAAAGRRVALVIGNSAYQSVARLDNPRNDAGLIADTLAALGFTLVGGGAQLDLDKASLDKAVQNFGRQIQGADVTLFYYAGHGVQASREPTPRDGKPLPPRASVAARRSARLNSVSTASAAAHLRSPENPGR